MSSKVSQQAVKIMQSAKTPGQLSRSITNILNDKNAPYEQRKAAMVLFVIDRNFSDDGGPGSGNWGHKGRPGQRGGSGKGGGKIMRTGNAASGFNSVKRDPAFKDVVQCAKKDDYDSFKKALHKFPSAWQALKDQHVACGTKEDIHAYRRRMYEMLHNGKPVTLSPTPAKPAHVVVQGKDDGFRTFRRNNQKTEIKDAIDHQGFGANPNVVDHDEFQKMRKDNPNAPLFFRTIRADSQSVLDTYNKQLQSGDWYVDCTNGGAQYGQGMYTVGVYDRKINYWDGVDSQMTHYGGYGAKKFATRAMMLDPSAKIFTPTARPNHWSGQSQIRQQLLNQLKTRINNDPVKVQKNVDTFLQRPQYKQQVQQDKDAFKKRAQDVLAYYTTGRASAVGLKSLQPQMDILQKMNPQQRDKLLQDFITAVDENRVRRVATLMAGYDVKNMSPYSKSGMGASCAQAFTKEQAKQIQQIAIKTAKTKSMAKLLAKIYSNPGQASTGRFSNSRAYTAYIIGANGTRQTAYGRINASYQNYRKPLSDLYQVINQDAETVNKYRRMNAGSLAALMGYDAINAKGHGRTGSYTVILNRTKVILDKDYVDLKKPWKG